MQLTRRCQQQTQSPLALDTKDTKHCVESSSRSSPPMTSLVGRLTQLARMAAVKLLGDLSEWQHQ